MDRRLFIEMMTLSAALPLCGTTQEPSPGGAEPIVVGSSQTRGPDGRSINTADWKCKLRTSDLGGRLSIIVAEHPQFTGPQLHVHRDVDEWFHVDKGEFVIEVGGKLHYLGEGASLLAPQKIPHRYLNGPASGVLLMAFSPGGRMEEFFEEIAQRRRTPRVQATPQEAVARTTALYARYNMDFLGHGSLSEADFKRAKAEA